MVLSGTDWLTVTICCANIFLLEVTQSSLQSYWNGAISARGVSLTAIGAATGLGAIGVVVVGPQVPKLIQRFGGGPNVLAGGTGTFLVMRCFLAGLDLVYDPTMIIAIMSLVYVFQFSAGATVEACTASIVMSCTEEEDRTKANGIVQAFRALGGVVGPPIGGVLYEHFGFAPPILIVVGLMAINYVVLLFMLFSGKMPPYALDDEQKDGKSDSKSILRIPVVALAGSCFFFGCSGLFFPITFIQPFLSAPPYNLGQTLVGFVLSMGFFGILLGGGSAAALEKKFGPVTALAFSFGEMALGYMVLGPSPLILSSILPVGEVWVPAVGNLIVQMGFGSTMTLTGPLCMSLAVACGRNKEDAAQQIGVITVLAPGLSLFVIPALGGLLADLFGAAWASTIGAIGFAVAGVLIVPSLAAMTRGMNLQHDAKEVATADDGEQEEEMIPVTQY